VTDPSTQAKSEAKSEAAEQPETSKAVFTNGSIMRHVSVMTASGSIGLVAIFAVDFLSLLYVSWLGDVNLTAGVGYATAVLFFSTSVNVGLMIAIGASVSRALGAGDGVRARGLAATSLVICLLASAVVIVLVMLALGPLLTALGARNEAYDVAYRFLLICMPSNLLLAIGMGFSGLLRAVGDARRAMLVTLIGGCITAAIDPIMIFGFGLGTEGAAWATVISRMIYCGLGYYGAVKVHDLVGPFTMKGFKGHATVIMAVAAPAILTNIATPVSNAFMTAIIAPFGDEAVAANAIITRLVPLAFGTLFALSGAVGPIFGQNLGAGQMGRVRDTLTASLKLSAVLVAGAWLILIIGADWLGVLFKAEADTAMLLRFFCEILAGTWLFNGGLFVANAAFNNLGAPLLATVFNWGRATIGTIPFAYAGAAIAGAKGALLGQALGAICFGIAAVIWAYRLIAKSGQGAHN